MLRRFHIIILVLLSLTVAFSLTWFNYKNVEAMTKTMAQLQQPDNRLSELKQLVLSANTAESYVRSFAITRKKKYLDNYYVQVNAIDSQSIQLKKLFKNEEHQVDTLTNLIAQKFEIYEKLIDLRYTQLINEAVDKISGKVKDIPETVVDTIAERSGFFKRLFGSAKRIKQMELKAHLLDSLNSLQAEKLKSIRRAVYDAQSNEIKTISDLSDGELMLLEKDRILKEQLQQQITFLEEKIVKTNAEKSQEAIRATSKKMETMMLITVVSSVMILLLTILILWDIGRANRYKTQLEAARIKSDQLAKFKEDFLATMSHEIRTPLSALTGFSKKLLQTNTSGEQKQYIKIINSAGDHLLNIVNDVLDLSRIETGKLKFENEPFSIYKTIQETHQLLHQKAMDKAIAFTLDVDAVKYDVVMGDAMRLKQILLNVCGNALKFTEKGFVHLSVTKAENNHYVFKITDTGVGIPDEKLADIFNPYEQANNIEKNYGGTGLGLAITRKMVEILKGSIHIVSAIGKGTTITIQLAYDTATNPPLEEEITSTHPSTLNGYKILLTEDDFLNRELAKTALQTAGASVIIAENGQQAIEKLLLENPDALLMDIQMPVMNGRQATLFIRENISDTIPIIGITANLMNDAKSDCLAAGMHEVILKPFDLKSLTNLLLPLLKAHNENKTQHESLFSFSLDNLFKTSNGKVDFVIKMLKIFISSNSSLLEKTIRCAEEKNYQQAAANIHRLIPSFRQIELDAFASIFKNMEWLLINGEQKEATVLYLNECRQQFRELCNRLQTTIDNMEGEKTNV
jgi:signal transduction histidine kinase/response regulator of citrate/malate metabolism